ncbi:alpha-acetolactate decarboxylase [Apodospora peruviana]|uniref:Alpha-acetolactate decarboxylase n=1 Tax=Apodospora peruviana TaxID=516989 RepID=A0AAE0HTX9_9PEZI|nr:alpha-acetolactate decarboxylase [Apodospora peruviana]
MAHNEIHQYSIVSALMDGVASHGVPISTILAYGDHGLGTFRHMDGEMIMKADGSIIPIDPPRNTMTPFASATRFQPTVKTKASLKAKQDLADLLESVFPSGRNHFLAFRMDGLFSSVHVRTAAGQGSPRDQMPGAVERQTTHTFHSIRGTVIGFRAPEYVTGINVVGNHLHFISEDRQRGGHILALETEGEVDVQAASLSKFHLELPTEDE